MPSGIYKRTPDMKTGKKKHSQETKQKISLANKGKSSWNKGLFGYRSGEKHHWFGKKLMGEENPHWKGGPLFWKKKEIRNDSGYIGWVKMVKERDLNRCQIGNGDCSGKLEVHHILSWRVNPELRYTTSNGITLCHFHHPRKRSDEERLSPYFTKIISNIQPI